MTALSTATKQEKSLLTVCSFSTLPVEPPTVPSCAMLPLEIEVSISKMHMYWCSQQRQHVTPVVASWLTGSKLSPRWEGLERSCVTLKIQLRIPPQLPNAPSAHSQRENLSMYVTICNAPSLFSMRVSLALLKESFTRCFMPPGRRCGWELRQRQVS